MATAAYRRSSPLFPRRPRPNFSSAQLRRLLRKLMAEGLVEQFTDPRGVVRYKPLLKGEAHEAA